MKYRLLNGLLLLIFIALLVNLVNSWWRLSLRGDVIKQAEDKLLEARQKQDELKRNLAKAHSTQFIEEQARDKLNLSREGETVLILPPITPVVETTPTPTLMLANWEKWVNVFK